MFLVGLLVPIFNNYLLALVGSPDLIGLLLLLSLLSHQLGEEHLLSLLRIKGFLNPELVNLELSVSPLALLTSVLVTELCLLDLVHRSSVREVLDLARWDAFLLLLSLDSLLNCNVFFNSQLSQVFMEL